jgi:IS5 family transposase
MDRTMTNSISLIRRKFSYSLTEQEIRLLSRRQAVEPIIGHLKEDHRMGRCHLKGEEGDPLHAVLFAAGYNIRWLLRMIAKKGLRAFLRLVEMAAIQTTGRWLNKLWSADHAGRHSSVTSVGLEMNISGTTN